MTAQGTVAVVLGALAGGMAAVALRELAMLAPGIFTWLAGALEPLRRAGREGRMPTEAERTRLAVIGAVVAVGAALAVFGPGLAPLAAAGGPALASWAVGRRRAGYRAAVDRGLADVAVAVADGLAAGRSARAALAAAPGSLSGPPAREMARLRAELLLGTPTREALAELRHRVDSPRVDAFAAAILSQRLAGGDLAVLLRRFAASSADRDRTEADARSATAQARFTGLLVVAMPAAAAVLAELLDRGFIAGLLGDPAAAALLAAAVVLQLAGFAAIRRLCRIEAW